MSDKPECLFSPDAAHLFFAQSGECLHCLHKKPKTFSYPVGPQRIFRSVLVYAYIQADLSPHWTHKPYSWFSHDPDQINFINQLCYRNHFLVETKEVEILQKYMCGKWRLENAPCLTRFFSR